MNSLEPITAKKKIILRKQVKNLKYIFNPKTVAIVGASRNPSKIGHVILRNFLKGGYKGEVYPINLKADKILGKKVYKKCSSVSKDIDCAIICIPARFVLNALEDAKKKNLKSAIVITGGFSEIGNKDEELKIKKFADTNDIALIGPNCMGVINPSAKVDSVFLPIHKMGRPPAGSISFISQSGAVGGCVVDLASRSKVGMAKFVSYGNGTVINETDLINYLISDKKTNSVVSYIEGVKNGRKFMSAVSSLTPRKPFVVLKAGKSSLGAKAASSHTASLAGSSKIFSAAMNQCGAIQADTLDELFDLIKMFDIKTLKKDRICVITNGGGNGVLTADAIEKYGLHLAQYHKDTLKSLKKILPPTTKPNNPLDLVGDADSERYAKSIEILQKDKGIDAFIIIILMQTASLDSSIIDVLLKANSNHKKPIIVISTGGEYTQSRCRILDSYQIPTYSCPDAAVKSLTKLYKYFKYKQKLN